MIEQRERRAFWSFVSVEMIKVQKYPKKGKSKTFLKVPAMEFEELKRVRTLNTAFGHIIYTLFIKLAWSRGLNIGFFS